MNYIWGIMIVVSLVVGALNGRLDATVQAGLGGAKDSIEVVLSFAGVMCLWTGLLKLAEKGGISRWIEKLLSPLTRVLFPKISGKAKQYITMNMTANLLGMGNAATPMGIRAMQELDQVNPNPERISEAMCTFVVINTASLQLIPTTIIALRTAAGSQDALSIIVPVWITSVCALIAALISVKILYRIKKE